MKKTLGFLIFVCVLSTLSCTPKKENIRKDVFGVWEATKESLKKQNENKVFSFQLNEDSTALICRNDLTQEKSKGKWLWNVEKNLGNSNFGINFRYDVRLDVNYALRLGLLLEERRGYLYLTAGDYEFRKID